MTADSDGTHVTLTIRCDSCEGGTFTIATAHMETLARVLPKMCKDLLHIDLDKGVTETAIFEAENSEEMQAKADAFYQGFLKRRKAQEN